jgi:predicted HTH domain antitoxin
MHILSVRLDEDLEKKLDFLMKNLKKIDKSAYIRHLLDRSLSEDMTEVLCKQIGEKKMSAWKAAEILGISLRRMLDELKKSQILGYDDESFKEDLEFALKF